MASTQGFVAKSQPLLNERIIQSQLMPLLVAKSTANMPTIINENQDLDLVNNNSSSNTLLVDTTQLLPQIVFSKDKIMSPFSDEHPP
jgi:hypothetical protein